MTLCKRCGRNLTALGPYTDFVHYRADRITEQVPCVELGPFYEMWLIAEKEYMLKKLQETVSEIMTRVGVSE